MASTGVFLDILYSVTEFAGIVVDDEMNELDGASKRERRREIRESE